MSEQLSTKALTVYQALLCAGPELQLRLAAAIEALADQVVPKEQLSPLLRSPGLERLCQRQYTRFELLAIAAELRGQAQPSSEEL